MPELPEIETIRKSITPHLLLHKILAVDIRDRRLRRPAEPDDFRRWVDGHFVTGLSRRSKYLIWHLENDAAVVIHLGMSGWLGLAANDETVEKHTHVIFQLEGERQIRFRDPRRFGLVEVAPPGQLDDYQRFKNLGVEPLSADFNYESVANLLKNSRKPIKNWLMDAQIVVGVGNIYANEALFRAGIHPTRPANTLKNDEQRQLVKSVTAVLDAAIEKGGTTLSDFRDAEKEPGYFQLDLAVYQREGQVCLTCGANIERIVMSGRSTFFCPSCQK